MIRSSPSATRPDSSPRGAPRSRRRRTAARAHPPRCGRYRPVVPTRGHGSSPARTAWRRHPGTRGSRYIRDRSSYSARWSCTRIPPNRTPPRRRCRTARTSCGQSAGSWGCRAGPAGRSRTPCRTPSRACPPLLGPATDAARAGAPASPAVCGRTSHGSCRSSSARCGTWSPATP